MWALASLIIGILGLCIFPFLARAYLVEVAMMYFMYIILAQSYRLIVTIHDWQLYHVVLYGVGAYTSGMLAKNLGVPVFAAIPLGGAMASLMGVAITLPLLRTKGWGFYIATYGLAELVRLTWLKFRNPFGGSTGIIEIPYPPVVAGIDFSARIPYYFFSLGVMLAIMFMLYRVEKSQIGDSFKAVSTDSLLAASTGINISRHRLLACAIGGFFAGIAGGLLVHRLGAVDPKLFNIITMLYLLIWVVVGGTNTFWGPVIGVVVMQTLFEISRPLIQIRPMFFGLSMVFVLIFMPGGIEGLISKAVARWGRLRGEPNAEAE
ncbi:MAG: branched-chain amino acid ABC transporter permease [Proteobacteria bacterium]|nr:branched-chain amino acid ABC transporter permease [Pseudomonadota bacterium]NIS72698.1 branched-chain amino acid ABC transporter permease [Pseudomonadota bacterium]